MAAIPSAHDLAKPWRTSTRSGGGACVEIALVVGARAQAVLAGPVADTGAVFSK
jgi:hypothetical protein